MSLKFILLLSPAYIQGVVKVIDIMVSISLSAERPFRLNPLRLLVPLVLNRVAEPGRPFVAFTRRFDLLPDLRLISTPDDIDPSIPLEPSSPAYYIDRYFRINTWLTQTFMETRTVNNIYSQKYEKKSSMPVILVWNFVTVGSIALRLPEGLLIAYKYFLVGSLAIRFFSVSLTFEFDLPHVAPKCACVPAFLQPWNHLSELLLLLIPQSQSLAPSEGTVRSR